jgi:hypothetical protein
MTPNFRRYETRTNGGEWNSAAEKFEWTVKPGANRLEARTVNAFGVTGPVSTAEVAVN